MIINKTFTILHTLLGFGRGRLTNGTLRTTFIVFRFSLYQGRFWQRLS